ncbi:MAG: 6-carboxytetrahydropterin synthase [Acidobacteria bacterium]|nr:6-carboxytetrahydropterin synthase [Acidobacteriota bacterium]
MLITRREEFSASHACLNPALTPERNRALYGEDSNPNGHGHNYAVEVTLEGEPDPVSGMVFDLKHLKSVIRQAVIEPFDHRFLNLEVQPFDRVVPTTENVAREIWRRLEAVLPAGRARLFSVRLYETEDLFADYFGERP